MSTAGSRGYSDPPTLQRDTASPAVYLLPEKHRTVHCQTVYEYSPCGPPITAIRTRPRNRFKDKNHESVSPLDVVLPGSPLGVQTEQMFADGQQGDVSTGAPSVCSLGGIESSPASVKDPHQAAEV